MPVKIPAESGARQPTAEELRVAKAIYETARANYAHKAPAWDEPAITPDTRNFVILEARAAIRAIREPTRRQLEAADTGHEDFAFAELRALWRAENAMQAAKALLEKKS